MQKKLEIGHGVMYRWHLRGQIRPEWVILVVDENKFDLMRNGTLGDGLVR
jgi:hypothetical protein